MTRITMASLVVLVVVALAAAFWRLGNLPFAAALVLVLGGVLFTGLMAMIEDDLPGGFNNPDGTDTPKYIENLRSYGKWLLVCVFGFAAVVMGSVVALEGAVTSGRLSLVATLGIVFAFVAAAIAAHNRVFLWSAFLFLVAGLLAARFNQ